MINSKSKILISACLIGQKVRYDGKDCLQANERLQKYIQDGKIVTICPEVSGGMGIPRPPSEIETGKNAKDVLSGLGKIVTINGDDVTSEYIQGAKNTLALAQKNGVKVAILKAKSPSCGSKQVYDGSYSKTLIDGVGITAALLNNHDIQVFDETEIDKAIDYAESLYC